jgi:hypothetical protein
MNSGKLKRRERYKLIECDPQSRDYKLTMLRQAKARARKRNIFFDLTLEDIHIGESCPILGIPFEVGAEHWYNSPSLDRINNKRGYEPDNIIVVCTMANSIKNQATPKQVKKVGKFYAKLYKERSINVS